MYKPFTGRLSYADDYKKIKINKVILGGKIVVSNGKIVAKIYTPKVPTWMKKTVKIPKLQPKSFNVTSKNNVETVNTILMRTEIVTKKITRKINISFDYPLTNDVMKVIHDCEIEIVDKKFAGNCSMTLEVRKNEKQKIISRFEGIYGVLVK